MICNLPYIYSSSHSIQEWKSRRSSRNHCVTEFLDDCYSLQWPSALSDASWWTDQCLRHANGDAAEKAVTSVDCIVPAGVTECVVILRVMQAGRLCEHDICRLSSCDVQRLGGLSSCWSGKTSSSCLQNRICNTNVSDGPLEKPYLDFWVHETYAAGY